MVASSKISGNQSRKMKSMSRLYAVQALFQMEHSSFSNIKVEVIYRIVVLNFKFLVSGTNLLLWIEKFV